ncbi:MAG: preprotein translocase subunit YajC [Campylobacterales bacterium]|nr:preprotein translocase subunit YajC [Campylobacterales bacterium]
MEQSGSSLVASLLPLLILFGIFYFLIIRPQQKQVKQHKEMIEGLKKGDKIVTSGGIYAEVVKPEDDFIKVKIADEVFVKISKDYVAKKLDNEQNS